MALGLNNPYIAGAPIKDKTKFFGRDDLFRFIEDNLLQGVSVILLHGQRRIGKSSILSQIPNFLSHLTDFIFIPLSLEGQSQGSLADILHHLATGIVSYLNLTPEQVKIPSQETLEINPTVFTVDFFIDIYTALGDRKPVLLLDEFDTISDRRDQTTTENFFRHLQSLILAQPARFCLIPVVGRRLDDLQILVSLFREAPRREVGLLNETYTKRLITQPSQGILEYDAQAIEAIWQLTAGHPYFTQILCSALFEKARDKYEDEVADWNQITQKDVEQNIDAAIEKGDNGLAWFRLGLPIAERVVFAAIAEMQEGYYPDHEALLKDQGVIITDELEQALENLKIGGFIKERRLAELSRDRPYSYAIMVELVRRWFIKRHSLRKEILELDQLHPEVIPLYEQAKALYEEGNILQSIELYEQVLQVNPNHFSSLFAIAAARLEDEQYAQAVELYTRICKVDHFSVRYQEAFVKSLLGYGRDLMQAGQLTQAKTQFSTALALDPENKRSQQQLAKIETEFELQQKQQQISENFQTLRNPFFVGAPVPPERFIGRKSLIQTAFDQIHNRYHLAIWGNTGVGKSSLLQLLASPQVWLQQGLDPKSAIVINLNCADIIPFTPSAFWATAMTLLKDNLHSEPEIEKQIDTLLDNNQASRDSLRQILGELRKREKLLLFLIDDYDMALVTNQEYSEKNMQQFLSECRNLAVHSEGRRNLSMIVASRKRLNDLSPRLNPSQSPWYNNYLFRQIKSFDRTEVKDLLKLLPHDFKLTEELQQIIQEISGGYPVLLQIACYLIYDFWRSGQNLNIENYTREFLKATEHIFKDWWLDCTDREQMLLILIALSRLQSRLKQRRYELINFDLILSSHDRTATSLEEMGLIKRVALGNNHDLKFTSAMMEFWVLREVESIDEDKLKQVHKIALDLMSHQQAEQMQLIIRGLIQSKDGSASVIDWFSTLAGNASFSLELR